MSINNPKDLNKENLTDSLKDDNKMICEDGFCFLPNLDTDQSINNEKINIFDPI